MSEQGTDLRLAVAQLLGERDVVNVLYDYGHALDYGPEEAFVDLFTPDAVWRRVPGRQEERVFSGRAAFHQMYRDHVHAPEYFHKHVVANPTVTVDGDSAQARSYLILIAEHPTGPYVRAFSRCLDRLVRCDDGKWRLAGREAELECWSDRDFPPRPWSSTPTIVAAE